MIHLYLGKHECFRQCTVKKTRFPCLLKGSLAFIFTAVFSGLLINMQYVKKVCGKIVRLYRNFLMYGGEKDGFSTRTLHQLHFPLVRRKCCYLLNGKIEKAYLARKLFSLPERRNSLYFFQTRSLVHSQNSRVLITFFRITLKRHERSSLTLVPGVCRENLLAGYGRMYK